MAYERSIVAQDRWPWWLVWKRNSRLLLRWGSPVFGSGIANIWNGPNPAYNTGHQAPYAGEPEARPRWARDRIYGNISTPAARAAFARS